MVGGVVAMAPKKRIYLGFDFETANLPTTLSPAFPIEMAAILIDAHSLQIINTYHTYIKLADGVIMEKKALETHGHTEEFLNNAGEDFWIVRDNFITWLAANGHLVPDGGGWDAERSGKLIPFGQNVVQFDTPILRKLLGTPAEEILSRYSVDTMYIADFINQAAFKMYGGDGFIFRDPVTNNPSANLAAQMATLGIDNKGQHGALFDIISTLECYRKHIENYCEDMKKSSAFDAAGMTLPPLPRY